MVLQEIADFIFIKEDDDEEDEDLEPFDWKWMCMPRLPWRRATAPPPFYGLNQRLPWGVALVMGFQHALAMIGGVVTVPLLISGPFDGRFSSEEAEYLISAGLICSGLLSVIQIKKLKFGNSGYFVGTGMISVLGTSFTFVPIARTAISFMMSDDSNEACASDADCTHAWADLAGDAIPGVTNVGQCNLETGMCKYSGQQAYGAFLGTCMVCSLLELGLSVVPKQILKRCFPPMVTGVCVLLIGIGLTGSGLKYWGGGTFCAEHSHKRSRTTTGADMAGDFSGALYPSASPCAGGHCVPFQGALSGVCAYTPATFDPDSNVTKGDVTVCEAFKDLPGVFPATPAVETSMVRCTGNGEVVLPFGSPQYVGLGFAVFGSLLFFEIFSSPFLRNCEVALALLLGFVIASAASYTPPDSDTPLSYVTNDRIVRAPGITFLWVHTFPLSVYGPAILPLLISYMITAIETIGDVSASAEASRLATDGPEMDERVQGGLTADAVCALLACLGTSMPNTTFSENSGVISLTRCANRRAGYCCAFFLVLFGVLAKTSAVIASIPDCVLGGMTTFIFVNISISGLKILGPVIETRRNRFIVAAALALGIGVALVPQWATNALITDGTSSWGKLASDSAVIVLSTPYCIGTLVTIVLHAVVPEDDDEDWSIHGTRTHDADKHRAVHTQTGGCAGEESSLGFVHPVASQQRESVPITVVPPLQMMQQFSGAREERPATEGGSSRRNVPVLNRQQPALA